ncbi:MAG: hypothetical protein MI924_04590 [Chloroflexales bacterium]|nr:hypothetical protein [Chloroflexales bacterium]
MQQYILKTSWLLLLLLSLVQCGIGKAAPTDQQIGEGYVAVTAKQALSPAEIVDAIAHAQQEYRIWRLVDDGKTTTQPFSTTSTFCLPEELRGQPESATGQVVLVRLVSKTDELRQIPLFFTKWDGVDDWFVKIPSEPAKCYRLASNK